MPRQSASANQPRQWGALVVGLVVGPLLTFGVYVPAGEPDAAEVTFGFSLLTILGAFTLGRALAHGTMATAGRVLLGLGAGATIGFVLVFFIPLIAA